MEWGLIWMWLFYAMGSALFAGLTSILAKVGIRNTDSTLATALRTVVVTAFAWVMVLVVGSAPSLTSVDRRSMLFLLLSGLATGGSWLFYFKALQLGDINKVVPIDKSSTVLTMLLAFLLLKEPLKPLGIVAMVLIAGGTLLMIEPKAAAEGQREGSGWLLYALGAAVFASLTAILSKIGIAGVESNLGTAIRTVVVLLMAWMMVFVQGRQREIGAIDGRSWLFIVLSGLATGLSWLCYYRALQDGPASVVVPVDKLSILITVAVGALVFGERLSRRAALGLCSLVAGTLCLLL